jgi:hypothetical protein
MTPYEKAKQLYNIFQQHTHDEELGTIADDAATRIIARKVVNQLEIATKDCGSSIEDYWNQVKEELTRVYYSDR